MLTCAYFRLGQSEKRSCGVKMCSVEGGSDCPWTWHEPPAPRRLIELFFFSVFALTKLHKHALVYPFVIPFPPLHTHLLPRMPWAGCHQERDRERERDMSCIISHSSRFWMAHLRSAPLMAPFPRRIRPPVPLPLLLCLQRASPYRNQLIDTAVTSGNTGAFTAHSLHCNLFHGWIIWINTAAC